MVGKTVMLRVRVNKILKRANAKNATLKDAKSSFTLNESERESGFVFFDLCRCSLWTLNLWTHLEEMSLSLSLQHKRTLRRKGNVCFRHRFYSVQRTFSGSKGAYRRTSSEIPSGFPLFWTDKIPWYFHVVLNINMQTDRVSFEQKINHFNYTPN